MINVPDQIFAKRHPCTSGYHEEVFHDDDHVLRTLTNSWTTPPPATASSTPPRGSRTPSSPTGAGCKSCTPTSAATAGRLARTDQRERKRPGLRLGLIVAPGPFRRDHLVALAHADDTVNRCRALDGNAVVHLLMAGEDQLAAALAATAILAQLTKQSGERGERASGVD